MRAINVHGCYYATQADRADAGNGICQYVTVGNAATASLFAE